MPINASTIIKQNLLALSLHEDAYERDPGFAQLRSKKWVAIQATPRVSEVPTSTIGRIFNQAPRGADLES